MVKHDRKPATEKVKAMQPEELREAIEQLGLSQRGFARTIGVSDRAVRRWIKPGAVVPDIVAIVASLLIRQQHLGETDTCSALMSRDNEERH